MQWIRAVVLMFSTYTRIKVPQIKWDDKAMRLAIAFLPFVGIVLGCLMWGWYWVCTVFEFNAVLFAAVALALPIFVTGGIHMDGYCDTSDALASWQTSERRLEIMKDPNVGAFALIRVCVYLLLSFALLHELFLRGEILGLCFIYTLSRCFAVWSAITLPNARKGGMLAAFTDNADRRAAGIVLALLFAVSVAGLLWVAPPNGIMALILCLPVTLWYKGMARKHFGGVTGDTTGFYLQTIELFMLVGLLAGGILWV